MKKTIWVGTLLLLGLSTTGLLSAQPKPPAEQASATASQPTSAPAGHGKQQPSSALGSATTRYLPAETGALRYRGAIGYIVILALCFLLSRNRKAINWRTVGWAVVLQVIFAAIVLSHGQFFFDKVDYGVRALLGFADSGIDFVFQGIVPHQVTYQAVPGEPMTTAVVIGRMSPVLKTLAFSVLPTVIFFSSLIAVLYHLGIMQLVVRGMAWVMAHAMKTSGAETLSCTANIFVGQTEAPLLVRPFIDKMTQSELMAVMTGGFATVAGGILAIYVGMLGAIDGIAGHLVTASIMAAPAALGVSKLLFPETERSVTAGAVEINVERPDANVIEAAARGAADGMTLVLNIVAMLIAFVGLVALINAVLGLASLSIEQLLGWLFSPFAWLIGIPWAEATKIGELLGKKLVLTELLAFIGLKDMLAAQTPVLSRRSAVISSYALCGFANIASIGIQIGGIGGMAPKRRADLARLGVKAMFAGALVSLLSGAIAGMMV